MAPAEAESDAAELPGRPRPLGEQGLSPRLRAGLRLRRTPGEACRNACA